MGRYDDAWCKSVAEATCNRHEFSAEEMDAAFDRIKNVDDWRAPITAIIKRSEFELMNAACEFYTGTRLFEQKVPGIPDGYALVNAVGYRHGPCGP